LAAIEINASNPHLWILRYSEDVDVASYLAMVEESIHLNPQRIPYGVIMDMRLANSSGMSSKARQEVAAVMKQHESWFAEVVVCSVRVTPNPIVRGALTVYDWISPSKWPRKSVSNGQLAEAWARSRLAAAGISCAPEPVWCEPKEPLIAPSSKSEKR